MIRTDEDDPPLLTAEASASSTEAPSATAIKHIKGLRTVMFQLRAQDGLTDTVLLCNGNVRVPAHQVLLVATSPVLRDKVAAASVNSNRSTPLKLSLPDLDASTAEVLLEFIYTGRLNDMKGAVAWTNVRQRDWHGDRSTIVSKLKKSQLRRFEFGLRHLNEAVPSRNHHAIGATLLAAHKLRVDALYRRCASVLASGLSLTNVMDVWGLAEKCHDNHLKQQCVVVLARQLESRHRTSRYLGLPLEQFRTILTAASQIPNHEPDRLLHATLAWVNHDRRARSDHLGSLLSCFGLEADPGYLALPLPSPPKTPPVDGVDARELECVVGSGGGDDVTRKDEDLESDTDEPSFAGDVSRNSSPIRSPPGDLEQGSPGKGSPAKGSPAKGSSVKGSPTKGSPGKSPLRDPLISRSPIKAILLDTKSDDEETAPAPVLVLISTKGCDRVILEYLALGSDQWAARDVSLNLTINDGAAVAAFNDVLYFFGGSSKSDEKVSLGTALDVPHLRSYPTAPMRVAKAGAAAAVLGQQIYCVGGESKYGKALSHVERYCPRGDTWRILAPLRKARRDVAATSAGDWLLVVGGNDGNTWLPFAELYDPSVNEWTELAGITPGPTCRLVATETDGRVYVFRCQKTRGTLQFDRTSNSWGPAAADSGQAPGSVMAAQAYGEQVYAVDERRRVFVYYVHSGLWERLEPPSEWTRSTDTNFVHAALLSSLPEALRNRPKPAEHY